jgi:hypothetical protein
MFLVPSPITLELFQQNASSELAQRCRLLAAAAFIVKKSRKLQTVFRVFVQNADAKEKRENGDSSETTSCWTCPSWQAVPRRPQRRQQELASPAWQQQQRPSSPAPAQG